MTCRGDRTPTSDHISAGGKVTRVIGENVTDPDLGALVQGRVRVALHGCLVLTLECPGDQNIAGWTTVLVAQPPTPVLTLTLSPPPGAGLATLSLVRLV